MRVLSELPTDRLASHIHHSLLEPTSNRIEIRLRHFAIKIPRQLRKIGIYFFCTRRVDICPRDCLAVARRTYKVLLESVEASL